MNSTQKKVHEAYHKKTKSQQKIIKENNFTYRHLIKYIDKYLGKDDKVLDIGCGAGTLDFYLASKGSNVTGIDISKTAIDACLKTQQNLKLKNLKFVIGDFQNMKLKERYDFIVFTEVIEHLEADKLALKQIYKLLKPKGILFLTTPSSSAPMYKLGLVDVFDKKVGHLRRYSKRQIVNLVKNNNFQILEIVKNEGLLRNFLFINDTAGKSIRFFKYFISDIVTHADNITLKLFGESNYFIIARKVS